MQKQKKIQQSKPNLWKARKSKKYSCIYRNKRYFKSRCTYIRTEIGGH